jgi:phage major head subunit gpT-like protein
VEDDNLDLYLPAIQTAALQLSNWKNQQAHKVIEQNAAGYDDVPFFSASHPENGTVVSNYQAGAGPAWYLLDVSKPVKPWLWWTKIAPKMVPKTSESDDIVFWRDQMVWGARARGGGGYGLWQYAYKSKAPLTPENLEAAELAMRDRVDDTGETLDAIPTVLFIPRQLRWDAARVLGPATIDGSDNLYKDLYRVIVSNRLTGA